MKTKKKLPKAKDYKEAKQIVDAYNTNGLSSPETKFITKKGTMLGITKWIVSAQVLFLWFILGKFLPGAGWFFLPLIWVVNRKILLTIALPYNIIKTAPLLYGLYNTGYFNFFYTILSADEQAMHHVNGTASQQLNSTITQNHYFVIFSSMVNSPYGFLITIPMMALWVIMMGGMFYSMYWSFKFELSLLKLQKRIRKEFNW